MPRTAPAPNLIAIPGMNPGNIVAGGGGGAGGGSGGSGKGGKGGKGRGPGKGGDGAEGGKKGSGDCGAGGAAGACTKHSAGASAGDPVDISTGEVFTEPHRDLDLKGIIQVVFDRKYTSTAASTDIGLGFGWCHTFDWRFEVKRRGLVVRHMGKLVDFSFDHHPQVAVGVGGWMLRKVSNGYVLDTNDGFFHEFSPSTAQPPRYQLLVIRHRDGSRLTLSYDELGQLCTITEVTGRPISLTWDRGRIVRLSMTDPTSGITVNFGRYDYDQRGDLVRYVDANGSSTEYAYDELHRLVHYTNANRLRFYFRYGQDGRCFETWGQYLDHADPALDPNVPLVLRDGSPAKGIHHVRVDYVTDEMTQVVDSQRLRTYHLHDDGQIAKATAGQGVTDREFDYRGNMVAHTDTEENTWRYEWDIRGRLTATVDPTGFREDYVRNFDGDVIKTGTSDGRSVRRRLDARGNPIEVVDEAGYVTFYEWDDRNLMFAQIHADGTRELYDSDLYGNLSRVTYADGSSETLEWDYFSRLRRHTNPIGLATEYSYSDSGQLLLESRGTLARVIYGYDPVGNLTSYTDDFGTIRLEYGGLNWLCARVFPNGEREGFLYNLEGWMTREVNERSESRLLARDNVGAVTLDRLFDGRSKTYEYNAESQVIQFGNVGGPVRRNELDALGNLAHVVYEDDTEEFFEYDQRGLLKKASGPGGSVEFVRDARGEIIQEIQIADGIVEHVGRAIDPLGRVRKLWLTEGEEFDFPRTARGFRGDVRLPGGSRIKENYRPDGALAEQVLPQGAVIRSDYDGIGRLRRRSVEVAAGQVAQRLEPTWVGGQQGVLLEKSFVYAQGPNPATKSDSHRALVNYRYDARERLLALEDERGDGEHFVHDPTGNLYEAGPGAPGRRYDGDRLLIRGNTRFEYDALGQLVSKVETLDDGAERVWSYEWNLKQHLAAVVRPDGMRVEFTYDPFSRRTFKHVSVPDPLTRELKIVRTTRYLWHLDQLVLERQLEPLAGGTLRETITTYLYGDATPSPMAQQRTVRERGTETKGPWLFLIGGQSEAPEELVDPSGVVHAHIDRSAYGVMVHRPGAKEHTTVGFMGQFFDAETGLFYNRERYYDPEIGRFINHDPVGTASGSNLYHYTANPIGYGDPLGLKKHPLTVEVNFNGGGTAKESFTSGRDTDKGKQWSDPGKSQWGTHTEPQAMNWLKEKHGSKLKGANVKMEGASPPCLMCSKRMRQFANETGATVEYTYPNDKTVKYAPGAKESPQLVPPQDDPGAKNLCDNYNKHHDHYSGQNVDTGDGFGAAGEKTQKPTYESPPDPHSDVTAKNPVWQSYQSEKGNAQNTDDDGLGDDPDEE